MEDIHIIRLYEERSENAITETKIKYGRLILALVHHILKSRADAEECENDTYFGMWNTIPPQKPKNLKAYTLKIARNHALKRYAYYHAEKRNIDKNISYDEIFKEWGETTYGCEETELTDCLNAFLEGLPAKKRKVFLCRYWYFMSIREIMAECEMGKSQVETMLFRIRNDLKAVLEEKGYCQK